MQKYKPEVRFPFFLKSFGNADYNTQITGVGPWQSCKSSQKPLVVSGFFSGRSKNPLVVSGFFSGKPQKH